MHGDAHNESETGDIAKSFLEKFDDMSFELLERVLYEKFKRYNYDCDSYAKDFHWSRQKVPIYPIQFRIQLFLNRSDALRNLLLGRTLPYSLLIPSQSHLILNLLLLTQVDGVTIIIILLLSTFESSYCVLVLDLVLGYSVEMGSPRPLPRGKSLVL